LKIKSRKYSKLIDETPHSSYLYIGKPRIL
jgi:hypothetical protein